MLATVPFFFFLAGTFVLGGMVPITSVYFPAALGATSLLILGGCTFLFGLRWPVVRERVTLRDWGMHDLDKLRSWRPWALAIGATLVLLPVRGVLGLVVELLLSGNLDSLENRADVLVPQAGGLSILMTAIGVAILVPIAEELFFRGLLHTWLVKRSLRLIPRLVLSSAVFAIYHLDSLGVVASSFLLGLTAAWVYERTGSLLMAIVVHMTTNGIAVLLLAVISILSASGLV